MLLPKTAGTAGSLGTRLPIITLQSSDVTFLLLQVRDAADRHSKAEGSEHSRSIQKHPSTIGAFGWRPPACCIHIALLINCCMSQFSLVFRQWGRLHTGKPGFLHTVHACMLTALDGTQIHTSLKFILLLCCALGYFATDVRIAASTRKQCFSEWHACLRFHTYILL